MARKAVFLLIISCVLSSIALCQENHFDATASGMGVLGIVSSGNQVTQNVTNSFGLMGTFRVRLNPHSSVAVNFSRTPDSQLYTTAGINYRVQDHVTEYSGVYMLNLFQRNKVQPFALGGVGALAFSVKNTYISGYQLALAASKQTTLTTIIGAGFDYRLPWRLALRVQYRGLIYNAPSFGNTTLFTGSKGYFNEPSVGIVFKF